MKILLLNQAFYPDVVATAQIASDLALSLVKAGHEVTVICSSRGYDNHCVRFPKHEKWNGINIVRISSTALGKHSKWRRAADFGTFIVNCAVRQWLLPQFDVVIALTSPPLISFVASLALPIKAKRLVFWSMDLNPDEAIAAGWLQPDSVAARMLSRMLLHSLHRADSIVALDRFMKERIAAKGIDANKILVVPPWSLDDSITFDPAGRDEFRKVHNISNKFVVMYSGNHSPCHPLETLLSAAERLAENQDIVFCFVGGGTEFSRVKDRARLRGLQNVLCLPYQPIGKLAGSLSAADLHVVIMGDPFVGIVHPCKVYNVLAVGKPFLYIGPSESHVTDIVREYKAYVAAHGDVEQVVTSILRARNNESEELSSDIETKKRFSKNSLVPMLISAIEQVPATCA